MRIRNTQRPSSSNLTSQAVLSGLDNLEPLDLPRQKQFPLTSLAFTWPVSQGFSQGRPLTEPSSESTILMEMKSGRESSEHQTAPPPMPSRQALRESMSPAALKTLSLTRQAQAMKTSSYENTTPTATKFGRDSSDLQRW